MDHTLTGTAAAADACGDLALLHPLGGPPHERFTHDEAASLIAAGEDPFAVLDAYKLASTIPGKRPHQWRDWVVSHLAHNRRRAAYAARTGGEA